MGMGWIAVALVCVGITGGVPGGERAHAQEVSAPLPNVEQLRQRAIASYAKTAEARERYLCRELLTIHEVDGKGGVKKTKKLEQESFYVHGHRIEQMLAKDDKPLSEGEQKKQAETVRKEIEEAMKPGSKKRTDEEIQTAEFLRVSKLTNGRRVMVSGRPTIVFDAAGNPNEKAGSIEGRFMQAMAGTVSVDEQTGNAQDINMRGMKDVKVGGGLVANIHKGFQLHVLIAPQPDGVWLPARIYASGDARLGLFLHPSRQVEVKTEGCKLSNVTSDSIEKMKADGSTR